MSEGSLRQLKAIMFTDIKGFSAMMGEDEARTVRVVREHREVVREALERHRGTERQTIGDAFLVLFDSAVNAVQCAVDIQNRLRQLNASRPEAERVWLRIGIHLGDILIDDKEVYGDGVNIAARVEPQAEPGGICITQQVFHQIEGKLDCRLIHIGQRELKNIRSAPELYQVLLQSGGETSASSPLAAGHAHLVGRDDVWPRQPAWKYVLWWLLALPFPLWLVQAPITGEGRDFLFSVTGGSLPMTVLFAAIIPAGLLLAAHHTSRFWAKGRLSPWLQGRYFVVFPVAGLLLFLYHYLALVGRIESAVLPVSTYTEVTPALTSQIAHKLAESVAGYANAYLLDGAIVSSLLLTVVLGYAFYPRKAGKAALGRRHGLVLVVGVVLVVAAELVYAGTLRGGGIGHYTVYLAWFLAVAAVLRSARERGEPDSYGLRAFLSGLILAGALSSILDPSGFTAMLRALARQPADMKAVFWDAGMAEITQGHWCIRLVGLAMFAVAAVLLHRGLAWDRRQPRGARALDMGSLVLTFAATMLPLVTFPDATKGMHLALSFPVSGMQPARMASGSEASFYIDPGPAPIGLYARRVLMELRGQPIEDEFTVSQLLDALAGGRECGAQLAASIGDPRANALPPAPCLTAIEARIACEVQGKRLATPDEWDAAVGVLAPSDGSAATGGSVAPIKRLALGEWTMRMVHGNPVFEVKGGGGATDIPGALVPTAYSPRVGFRCAWRYGE